MHIDWYTKVVLTVIAVALVVIAGEDYVLPAQAQELTIQEPLQVTIVEQPVWIQGTVGIR